MPSYFVYSILTIFALFSN